MTFRPSHGYATDMRRLEECRAEGEVSLETFRFLGSSSRHSILCWCKLCKPLGPCATDWIRSKMGNVCLELILELSEQYSALGEVSFVAWRWDTPFSSSINSKRTVCVPIVVVRIWITTGKAHRQMRQRSGVVLYCSVVLCYGRHFRDGAVTNLGLPLSFSLTPISLADTVTWTTRRRLQQ